VTGDNQTGNTFRREREREIEIYGKTYKENRLSDITVENKKF
jgi:hypothetical protein